MTVVVKPDTLVFAIETPRPVVVSLILIFIFLVERLGGVVVDMPVISIKELSLIPIGPVCIPVTNAPLDINTTFSNSVIDEVIVVIPGPST